MNNELRIFENNEGYSVRTITENGEIWFVAKDIAQALGYAEGSNPARLIQSVPQIWTGVKRFHIRSENGVEQERELLCLAEQGLYFFLGRSDKPAALSYQMWIAGEVVPSIRKTGSYTTSKTEAKPTHKLIQEAQKIVSAALNCKNEKDYQTAIAFDRIFKDFTGKSALEMAGMKLTKKTELEEYPDGCFWTDEHFEWESDLPSLD